MKPKNKTNKQINKKPRDREKDTQRDLPKTDKKLKSKKANFYIQDTYSKCKLRMILIF